ncbi:MAG TPA: 3-oxoacyl-ACP reductase FabG [Chlamydiales bacterium]|nr:3-oxoacyl-ACP reductase FabG [Chlamydiales bacterium]
MKDLDYSNEVVVVTGATAGIGKAIALSFAERGATVIAVGTNQERGAEVVREAKEKCGRNAVTFMPADISNKAQVDALINDILTRFQKIDILINNAGITKDGLLMKMSEEDWRRVLDVNLTSCFYTCQAVIRSMLKARYGRIINTTSVVGLIGNPGQTNYAASKAGLIGFTKSLAKEVASRNITVNCIAPGFIETHMTDFLQGEKKEAVEKQIPMGRLGKSEEIAFAALFLAARSASYITGHVLTLDGGLAM